ncbi:hypothetical protein B9G49_07535 [Halorubrum sp. SD683]|jgi:hypothetical protein|nr:hypothetical protein B9G49_07535 [Halorubrum sp. SD683]
MSDDGSVALVEKIIGSLENWVREDVSESVIPMVFPNMFYFSSSDIPVGVVGVSRGDMGSFEDTRSLALLEPVTCCTTG